MWNLKNAIILRNEVIKTSFLIFFFIYKCVVDELPLSSYMLNLNYTVFTYCYINHVNQVLLTLPNLKYSVFMFCYNQSCAFLLTCVLDFLNLRRKYRRHHCPHKRCLPLHSRVPFPWGKFTNSPFSLHYTRAHLCSMNCRVEPPV